MLYEEEDEETLRQRREEGASCYLKCLFFIVLGVLISTAGVVYYYYENKDCNKGYFLTPGHKCAKDCSPSELKLVNVTMTRELVDDEYVCKTCPPYTKYHEGNVCKPVKCDS